jgi:bifunctional non-homologous end joining protein LigD
MTARSPAFVEPMTATLVESLPEGPDWIYEAKLDGYRALILKNGERVQIRSRNDKDLTGAYPSVAAAAMRIRAGRACIDGELVAIDREGRPSFQALQHRGPGATHHVVFYAFDLLHLEEEDLRQLTLEERTGRLAEVLGDSGLLRSYPLPGTAAQVSTAVRALGLEGVIAKRRSSPYVSGARTHAWVKLKLDKQQEFVIGGYRPGAHGVDAILAGVYEGRELRFAGKVRAGFTPRVRQDVFAALRPLHAARCPFVDLPSTRPSRWGGGVTADQMAEMQWVRPRLVAQIRFVEWTADGLLRHAAFIGLRTDKDASGVRREG